MKKVCAWCKRPMNEEPENGMPISHGICELCIVRALPKAPRQDMGQVAITSGSSRLNSLRTTS